ncbi:MAG: protein-export chaperone SecB [Bacteroidota bacterium]
MVCEIDGETLDKLLYINAPALLFPYIRANISTLTNLSGFELVNFPTLNMTKLGNDLKKNTKQI